MMWKLSLVSYGPESWLILMGSYKGHNNRYCSQTHELTANLAISG